MVQIENESNETWIKLDASLDVGNASELKNSIKKVVGRKSPVVIDASQVTRLHTASMQVILAFVQTLREKQREFRWHQTSEQFIAAATILGLAKELGLQQ